MTQNTEFYAFPNIKADQFMDTLNNFLRFVGEEEVDFKEFRNNCIDLNIYNKDTFPQLCEFLGVKLDKKSVKLTGIGLELYKAQTEKGIDYGQQTEKKREILFRKIVRQNEILVKYVLCTIDEVVMSTQELFRALTSYLYPGKQLRLDSFKNWMNWMEGLGYIKVVGVKWGLTERGHESIDKTLKYIDVDELVAEEAEEEREAEEAKKAATAEKEAAEKTAALDKGEPKAEKEKTAAVATEEKKPEKDSEAGLEALKHEAAQVPLEFAQTEKIELVQVIPESEAFETEAEAPPPELGLEAVLTPKPAPQKLAETAKEPIEEKAGQPALLPTTLTPLPEKTDGAVLSPPEKTPPAQIETAKMPAPPLPEKKETAGPAWPQEKVKEEPVSPLPIKRSDTLPRRIELPEIQIQPGLTKQNDRTVANSQALIQFWENLGAKPVFHAMDLGLEKTDYQQDKDLYLFKLLFLGLLYIRVDSISLIKEAYKALDFKEILVNYFMGEMTIDDIFKEFHHFENVPYKRVFAENLFYLVLFKNKLIENPNLMKELEAISEGDRLIEALYETFCDKNTMLLPFWIVREMVHHQLWKQAAFKKNTLIPDKQTRQNAYRLGFINTMYAEDIDDLLKIGDQLSRLFTADNAVAIPHMPLYFGCQFNCANVATCQFYCREKGALL